MRLESLKLKNIRLFGDPGCVIDFSKEKNVTIILGDNGCGKSTILDCIAFMVSPFLSQFPFASVKNFTNYDVYLDDMGRMAPYIAAEAHFKVNRSVRLGETRFRKGLQAAPASSLKEIKDYAQFLKTQILENVADTELPVFAYYGTGRGQISAPERKRNFQKEFQRWDCYKSALNPSTDFKSFFAWFDLMEDEERREQLRREDFGFRLPALQAVRHALDKFVGEYYSSPRIELHPLRFVMSQVGGETARTLRIEQLSDGYKIIVAMVADIASRMAEANPHMADPLQSEGIILIDEIDLHLHPMWQRKVVSQLRRTFPNIQFILTTHSPVILSGAAAIAQIVQMPKGAMNHEDTACPRDLTTMDVGQILLSELFGLPSLQSPQWDADIALRNALLAKSELNEDENNQLEELNKRLAVLDSGDTPSAIKSELLLSKIAKHLGIDL